MELSEFLVIDVLSMNVILWFFFKILTISGQKRQICEKDKGLNYQVIKENKPKFMF